MAFQVSPGVQVKEIDLTNVVPAVSTSIGAYAGSFRWGPVDQAVQVGSEKDLVAKFGRPDEVTAKSFLTAAQFLAYGNDLRVARSNSAGLLNASSAQDSVSSVTVDTAGTGYTSVPTVSFSGTPDEAAAATATVKVVSVTVTNQGSGHAVNDTFTLNLGSGVEAVLTVTAVAVGGGITTVAITSAGDYTAISSGLTGVALGNAEVTVALGVSSVTLTSGGSGYSSTPTVSFSGAGNATATATLAQSGVLVKNADHKEEISLVGEGAWVAKYPGDLGNSLKVYTVNTTDYASLSTDLSGLFDSAPSAGEYHIIVVDEDGDWTGAAGSVLETFAYVGDTDGDKKEDGTNNYYMEVVNRGSAYVWAANPVSSSSSGIQLAGGSNTSASEGERVSTYQSVFSDASEIDVNLVIGGDMQASNANLVIGVAEGRKDCVAFVSPPLASTVGNSDPLTSVKTWADAVTSSSYAVMDSTAGYAYDKYNDKYRWVPASGAVAGLCANTDNVADAWFSPAGLNRGQLRGFAKLAFNPKQDQRDTLYKARVNPIVSFPGEGTVLFGDKTALSKPSAFDRINVRRLFITIEKAISTASRFSLFEFNDEFTRAQFLNLIEPFLRDVQGRRGITDFLVVCDETNNTGQVIDSNRFVADIYIKPARSINFITLNFIATRTGVEFSEIVGG